MPHPQDVAVPSLPEQAATTVGLGRVYTADQMNTRWLEGYEAGRAAGRASAEPEGFVLVPREPTEAMLIAARDWSITKLGKAVGNDGATGCYAAMLAAATTPTASIGPKGEGEAVHWCAYEHGGEHCPTCDAAPVAQAAAGALADAAKEAFNEFWREAFSKGRRGVPSGAKVFAAIDALLAALARPEADADRASGGGV